MTGGPVELENRVVAAIPDFGKSKPRSQLLLPYIKLMSQMDLKIFGGLTVRAETVELPSRSQPRSMDL
jgi:hypothetical protein